jgi:hypothetical protein
MEVNSRSVHQGTIQNVAEGNIGNYGGMNSGSSLLLPMI